MRPRHVGMVLLCIALSGAAFAQTPRKRRNIDCYSATDLALYKHAVQTLVDRNGPKTKPPVAGSYDYYAALHNGNGVVSSCSHMNELFMPWHRALLYEFERALQESDPAAGTRELMLPYWKWTDKPTGERFPAPFEVVGDVLYAKRRKTSAEFPAGSTRYTPADIANALKAGNWTQFGGSSCMDSPQCGGNVGGSLEDPYHNKMHGWVGGAMNDDITAGADPLFWLFHGYIDAIFAQWQASHPTEKLGCRACAFKAMTNWNPALVEKTADLGYEYDLEPCAAGPAARESAPEVAATPPQMLGKVLKNAAAGPAVFDLKIPAAGFRSAELAITGAELPSTFDYSGSVYLFPANVKPNFESADFRKRYFVDHFAVWGLHQHHPTELSLYVDATTDLAYLAKTQPGTAWKVAIVVDEITPKSEEVPSAAELQQMKSTIQFEAVSVQLDRGYGSRP